MKRRQFNQLIAAASALPLLGCEQSRQMEDIQGGFTGVNVERGHLLRETKSWPAPSKIRKTKVIIAGGGVAGLSAARALRLQGINDFVLLELEDRAGGNSKGGAINGITCPLGAHYLPVPLSKRPKQTICATCWKSWVCVSAWLAAGNTMSATSATARKSACFSTALGKTACYPLRM